MKLLPTRQFSKYKADTVQVQRIFSFCHLVLTIVRESCGVCADRLTNEVIVSKIRNVVARFILFF